jgi:hypothetical protein
VQLLDTIKVFYSLTDAQLNCLKNNFKIYIKIDIKTAPIYFGANDIRLISSPIHAPSHELEDTDTNTPLTKLISKRIFVELLGIREESVILYLWGMNPLA